MPFSYISKRVLHKLSSLGNKVAAIFPEPRASLIPDYLEFFKNKENELFSKKRICFPYSENQTIALALPCSNTALESIKDNSDALLKIAKRNIEEHMARRIDLFFYTLMGYYKTNAVLERGRTTRQYGRGRTLSDETNVTQACHSSFLPSILDQTVRNGLAKGLFSDTHFSENLNSTVELPHFVNAFDDFLEAILRPKCIEIAQKVSLGTLNPIQGLEQFLIMMNTLLLDFQRQAASKSYSSLKYSALRMHPHVHPKLIDLMIGVLNTTLSTQTSKVNEEYVQLQLYMTPEEKELCRRDPERKAKIYLAKILERQNEILTTESTERTESLYNNEL